MGHTSGKGLGESIINPLSSGDFVIGQPIDQADGVTHTQGGSGLLGQQGGRCLVAQFGVNRPEINAQRIGGDCPMKGDPLSPTKGIDQRPLDQADPKVPEQRRIGWQRGARFGPRFLRRIKRLPKGKDRCSLINPFGMITRRTNHVNHPRNILLHGRRRIFGKPLRR